MTRFSVTHFQSERFCKSGVGKTWFPTALCLVVCFTDAWDRAGDGWRGFCAWETSWRPWWPCMSEPLCPFPWLWMQLSLLLPAACLRKTSRKLLPLKSQYWWNLSWFGDGAVGGWMRTNAWRSPWLHQPLFFRKLKKWAKYFFSSHFFFLFSSPCRLSPFIRIPNPVSISTTAFLCC